MTAQWRCNRCYGDGMVWTPDGSSAPCPACDGAGGTDPPDEIVRVVPALRARAEAAEARVRELEAELARVQRLPEMDWATACAAFGQALGALARNGEQPAAQRALDVLDRLKAYVGRVVAERDDLRAEVERLRGGRG